MKIFFITNFIAGMSLSYLFWTSTSGQDDKYPGKYFVPFEFDKVHRGAFNLSECAVDLMQCWELLRPDVICSQKWYRHGTLCPTLKASCNEGFGSFELMSYRFEIHEQFCYRIELFT